MKILITVNSYYPLTDGVQSVTQYLAEGLSNIGHEVIVVTAKHNIEKKEEIYHNITILREDVYVKHALYFGKKKQYIRTIKKLADDSEIMINVCTQNPMTDLLLNELKNIPCKKVLYMHGMCDFRWSRNDFKTVLSFGHKIWNNIRWGYLYFYHKNNFHLYDKIIQIHKSEYGVRFMKEKYGIDCEIIENAAEDMFFEKEKKQRISILPNRYFIYVANYFEMKNQQFVLEAFYQSNINTETSMVFIGNKKTSYYDKLIQIKKDLDNKYGCRSVFFLENIERDKIPSYIANAELYLMGSKVEKFPVSIVEAMACGTPFISTDVGCVKYLPGGVIVNNEEEMARKIEKLMLNSKLKQKLANEGELYAYNNLRIDVKVKQLEGLLLNL